jgi:hypothetical protein
MADYYLLVLRSVHSAEARRGLYGHVRAALVKQLDAIDPPLSEDEKTNQPLALEQAIRTVEVESAKSGYIV